MRQVADEREDPRRLPAYVLGEAAHYLGIPPATVRSWVSGRGYPTKQGSRRAAPVIAVASANPIMLSFINLVEIHVLASITRQHKIPLPTVRRAVRFLKREFNSPHPLADRAMETDKKDLFIRESGLLINASQEGQIAIRDMLDAYLSRIERDIAGFAARLYPFTGPAGANVPRSVVIDPRISFGKPVLAGTNVPTVVIAQRYKAGESVRDLELDYGKSAEEIQEAIRCELELKAA